VTRLLRLEGRNTPARTAALARIALVPVLLAFEALDPERSAVDLWFSDALLYAFIAYAVAAAVYAFVARADVPLAPFAILDIALLGLFTCAEGGATSDVRYMLFVPVLVAVLTGPRLTLGLSVLSVAAFVAAAVLNPHFDREGGGHLLVVHAVDLAWRAGLAVLVAILLERRAERIRELAESRRSLVTQALGAEARARRELSYVLHDELVQELLCAQQDLKQARRGRPEYVDRAERALAGAVQRLRHEIFQLHPHLLETAGLEAALDAVAVQHARTGGEPAEITVAPDAAGVEDELLFSLGRELLTNAARHAGARHVEITVERAGEHIVLRCHDDGRGMDPERRSRALGDGHLGLAACTERVEALGGSLEIVSEPGQGTEVRAVIPCGVPPAAAPSERRLAVPVAGAATSA
jgi:two-component system, NarL family, sensor kinase